MLNQFYNEDCFETMQRFDKIFDCIITSPPYNTSRPGATDTYHKRYDVFVDSKTDAEYIEWTINLFKNFDKILKSNGTVLYNISYSSENPTLIWLLLADIIKNTEFMIADCITWKKSNSIPNNSSSNKLTRICEYVFVFCRKSENSTYFSNKVGKPSKKTNQIFYDTAGFDNIIFAKNNDNSTDENKATFSTEFVTKLIDLYVAKNSNVYDPFMGTGTTANACVLKNINFVGSELSQKQVEYSKNRIKETKSKNIQSNDLW